MIFDNLVYMLIYACVCIYRSINKEFTRKSILKNIDYRKEQYLLLQRIQLHSFLIIQRHSKPDVFIPLRLQLTYIHTYIRVHTCTYYIFSSTTNTGSGNGTVAKQNGCNKLNTQPAIFDFMQCLNQYGVSLFT